MVRVGHDDKIFAQFFAYRAHDANILIKIETDFDLHAVKSLLGKTARASSDLRRFFGIKRRGINWNFVPALTAKKLVERHAARFAENIPQRDVDAAQGDDADAARAELFMSAANVSLVPNLIDLGRIHTDKQRLKNLSDDHFDQFAVAGSGADSRDSPRRCRLALASSSACFSLRNG